MKIEQFVTEFLETPEAITLNMAVKLAQEVRNQTIGEVLTKLEIMNVSNTNFYEATVNDTTHFFEIDEIETCIEDEPTVESILDEALGDKRMNIAKYAVYLGETSYRFTSWEDRANTYNTDYNPKSIVGYTEDFNIAFRACKELNKLL